MIIVTQIYTILNRTVQIMVTYTVVTENGYPLGWQGSSANLCFSHHTMPIPIYDKGHADALLIKAKLINPSAKIVEHKS